MKGAPQTQRKNRERRNAQLRPLTDLQKNLGKEYRRGTDCCFLPDCVRCCASYCAADASSFTHTRTRASTRSIVVRTKGSERERRRKSDTTAAARQNVLYQRWGHLQDWRVSSCRVVHRSSHRTRVEGGRRRARMRPRSQDERRGYRAKKHPSRRRTTRSRIIFYEGFVKCPLYRFTYNSAVSSYKLPVSPLRIPRAFATEQAARNVHIPCVSHGDSIVTAG